MVNGIRARVVEEAFVEQDIVRPVLLRPDRIVRGAKPDHALTDDLLDRSFGALNVSPELLGALAGDELVAVTVASELVARPSNALDHRGMCLGYIANDEKRRARAVMRQDVQHDFNALLDPTGKKAAFMLSASCASSYRFVSVV